MRGPLINPTTYFYSVSSSLSAFIQTVPELFVFAQTFGGLQTSSLLVSQFPCSPASAAQQLHF